MATHATTEPRRCTAHLYDSSLLRGTTSAVLLNRFGSILKSTAGGIGLAHSGEDSYTKSEVASGGQLDIFLSHSLSE
ncbi:unnamed protein product [Effrenium voratum]|uniref:Uncharacterized protein n=1 Tax=Effrenium voratum TaxID=2562239 RepID=A0AA36J1W8_9DINO|nr:unnamed protein product [Effrenium voratum]